MSQLNQKGASGGQFSFPRGSGCPDSPSVSTEQVHHCRVFSGSRVCFQVDCPWSTSPSPESLREASISISLSSRKTRLLLHSVCMGTNPPEPGLCSLGWGLGLEPAAEVHPTILSSHTPLLCGSKAWKPGRRCWQPAVYVLSAVKETPRLARLSPNHSAERGFCISSSPGHLWIPPESCLSY